MQKKKRVIIKIGTNVLTTSEGKLDLNNLRSLVTDIATAISIDQREIILVSSGAITCGSGELNFIPKTIPEKQALAAIGQNLLMHEYQIFFGHYGLKIGQVLLTKDGFRKKILRKNTINTLNKLLEYKVVPIINENDAVATDEIKHHRFGDNDELSGLVASLIGADLLIILTDIDGLFNCNPKKYASAELIKKLEKIDDQVFELIEDLPSCRNRGGMCSKIQAAKKVSESGITCIIANGKKEGVLKKIFSGEEEGTRIEGVKGAEPI